MNAKDETGLRQKLRWAARSGVLVFAVGCLWYVLAWIRGDFILTIFGGLMWMSAVMQWALMYMEPRHRPEDQ